MSKIVPADSIILFVRFFNETILNERNLQLEASKGWSWQKEKSLSWITQFD